MTVEVTKSLRGRSARANSFAQSAPKEREGVMLSMAMTTWW